MEVYMSGRIKHIRTVTRKIRYILKCLRGGERSDWLRKYGHFALMGQDVLFQPHKLPTGTGRIKIHNNVKIAADVTFYEHDVINGVFAVMDNIPYRHHQTCIEIFENVFIGGKSIIVGNVKIGPNAIVAAGSVVTKNVEEGTIVAGNPAKVIGRFEDLHRKRMEEDAFHQDRTDEENWEIFYNGL